MPTLPETASEHLHQAHVVSWLRKRGLLVFAVPNGGKRGKREAQKLKTEGVTPGVPDLCVPALNLWIEMKTPTGRLSPVQKQMAKQLEAAGHRVLVCYGCDDAVQQLTPILDSAALS